MQPQGLKDMQGLIDYYMTNATTLREVLSNDGGLEIFGGDHSPYLWVRTPAGKT
jgi:LL-diaminopimelate aminotransferase